jgi:hypothetical protein
MQNLTAHLMTRRLYWSLILIPALLLVLVSGLFANDPAEFTAQGIMYIVATVPILGFLRMRYLKFTWKEMLLFFVPFISWPVKRRFYFEK